MAPLSAAGVNGDGGGGIPLSLPLLPFLLSKSARAVSRTAARRTSTPRRAPQTQASLFWCDSDKTRGTKHGPKSRTRLELPEKQDWKWDEGIR